MKKSNSRAANWVFMGIAGVIVFTALVIGLLIRTPLDVFSPAELENLGVHSSCGPMSKQNNATCTTIIDYDAEGLITMTHVIPYVLATGGIISVILYVRVRQAWA